jgi:hypothetical protein
MYRAILLSVFAILVAFPALVRAQPVEAEEAIRQSIAQPHAPLEAMWIEMNVCGSGSDGARGFLNSMREYRDRGSLNVELMPQVRAELATRLGGDPVATLTGYRVRFFGAPRQVRILLYRDGEPTGEYYFQTQVRLRSAILLDFVREGSEPVQAVYSALTS